ncbi:MAG: MFS transporter [Haloarculaceae archaeon]
MAWSGLDRTVRTRLARTRIYYGWVVVAGCFLGAMITFGTMYSFSVFFGFIADAFERSHSGTALVLSLQTVVTFGGAAALGFVIDRYGTRRLFALAALVVGAGLVGVSQAPSFLGVVLAYGVVTAAGLGVVYVVSYATIPRWFERRRGFATAVATSGAGVGIIVGPPLASTLIDRLGWQRAYLGLAVLVVALLLLVAFLIDDNPAAMDLDTGREFPTETPTTQAAGAWRAQLGDVAGIATSRAFAFAFLGYLLIGIPISIPAAHMVEFATSAGIGRQAGVLAVSVLGGMNVAGKFLVGPVADRVGIPPALAACSALIGVGSLGMAVAGASTVLLAVTVVFGLGYGGAIALLSPMLADLFGTENLNALFGLTGITFAIAGSLAPYLAGVGFDTFGTYTPVFLVAGVMAFLASTVLVVSHRLAAAG